MLRLYRCLLCLYPAEHRNQFGEEMIAVFHEVQAESENQSRLAHGIFWPARP
jgi:hypothetical protein